MLQFLLWEKLLLVSNFNSIIATWYKNRIFKNSFDGENFQNEASSIHFHTFVKTLGSYRNQPFVTGGYFDHTSYHVKTEIYNENLNRWMPGPDFPYSKS